MAKWPSLLLNTDTDRVSQHRGDPMYQRTPSLGRATVQWNKEVAV